MRLETHLGVMSLKSSILIRPAGESPIEMSKNTTGRPLDPAPLITAAGGAGDWDMLMVVLVVVVERDA